MLKVEWKDRVLRKAGTKRHMGIRPTVRGVAQDPKSHPHGGGEGRSGIGLKSPKTFAGRKAVGKTRDKKMKTPKLEQRGTPIQIDPQRGETIEMKVRRITQNKEPIRDVAQPIYMERGVKMASCDIRTDRWEVAREAKDKVAAAVSEKYQKKAEPKAEPKAAIVTGKQIGRAHV